MARAAAAAALLQHELDSLNSDGVTLRRTMADVGDETDGLGTSVRKTGTDIDRFSGRVRLLADAVAALGPGLIPIGSVGLAAVTGLASSLGFTTIAIGSTSLAFQGLGDALKAANKASLEPTVENLEAARTAMVQLAPEAQAFVTQLQALRPEVKALQASAAAGLFPGLGRGLAELEAALPRIEDVVRAITTQVGLIAERAGESLGSGEWDQFLDFVGHEGPEALSQMATAAGNTAHALAELWMATAPLNSDFLSVVVKASEEFDRWASGLSQTEGFQEFVAYIEANGPQVAETVGSIANALLQVVEAAAPLGGPVLRVVQALADGLAAIADSPLGTPLFGLISAFGALSLATRTYDAALKSGPVRSTAQFTRDLRTMSSTGVVAWARTTAETERYLAASQRVNSTLRGFGRSSLAVGGLALASSGLADQFGLANTASLGLAGSLAGPWGAAIGGAVGLVSDLSNALGASQGDIERYQEKLLAMAGPNVQDQLDAVNKAIEKQQGIIDDAFGPTFSVFGTRVTPFSFGDEWREAGQRLDALRETQKRLKFEVELGTIATDQAASSESRAAAAAARHAEALGVAQTAARKSGEAFVQFGKDINDPKVSLDQFIRNMQAKARALRDFTANSLKAARRGLNAGLIDSLRQQGPEGALRLEQLSGATAAQIQAANRAWAANKRAIQGNIDAATTLDQIAQRMARRKIILDIQARDKQAREALSQIIALAQKVPRTIRTYYIATQVLAANKKAAYGPSGVPITPADGTTVPGPRHPYRDRVPALLAPGEEVISNRYGQADRHRQLLKAINANRMADGGTAYQPMRPDWSARQTAALAPSLSFSLSDRDVTRIAGALAAVKSTYGDVYMQPHNYNEFRREMDADMQRSAGDGIRRGW